MDWKSYGRWLWGNFDKIALIGGWFMSSAILPYLFSLGRDVTPIGYGLASIMGLLSFAALRALWFRGQLWSIDAKARTRNLGESSYFDPMARVYENKRLYLRDLAPLDRDHVIGKKFTNCEIIGPGNLVLCRKAPGDPHFPQFTKNIYHNVDFIQIDSSKTTRNAIYFDGCDFDGCNFYTLNLLFYDRGFWGEEYPWITQAIQLEAFNEQPPNPAL